MNTAIAVLLVIGILVVPTYLLVLFLEYRDELEWLKIEEELKDNCSCPCRTEEDK